VERYAANAAKPPPSAPNNNVQPQQKRGTGYVGFMEAEVRGQKLKLGKSEVRQPVLLQANTLDQRYLITIDKKLWFEF
jgi:hypothetical protein